MWLVVNYIFETMLNLHKTGSSGSLWMDLQMHFQVYFFMK